MAFSSGPPLPDAGNAGQTGAGGGSGNTGGGAGTSGGQNGGQGNGGLGNGGLGNGGSNPDAGTGGSGNGGALGDGGPGTDGSFGAGGTNNTGGVTNTGGTNNSGGVTNTGGTNNSGGVTNTGGSTSGECAAPADCVTKYGAAPCAKQWNCSNTTCVQAALPNCTDGDGDGYGVGANCAACSGIDCDDTANQIHDTDQKSCYSGTPGTSGVGTCRAGLSTCTAGTYGPCVGEVIPSGEACNNQDDDCNAVKDDGLPQISCGTGACRKTVNSCASGTLATCTPGTPATSVDGPTCDGVDDDCDGAVDEDCVTCVPVDPNGNDGTADGTFANPFKTIQAAIDYAAANSQKRVCVASGAACGASAVYQTANGATITMADGVWVYGRYESTTWTRCANSTTTIRPRTPEGVTFPDTISLHTIMDGFTIERFQGTNIAGVTVDGAQGAVLSDVTITNTQGGAQRSYGVNVVSGGSATVFHSHITGGAGSVETVGVRAVGATVIVQQNCNTLDATGHCTAGCNGGQNFSVGGRTGGTGTGVSAAVLLDDAAGSYISQNAICNNGGNDGSGVRLSTDGKNVVIRQNNVFAGGSDINAVGVWMTDCGDAAPWIVDNQLIAGSGTNANDAVDGIRAVGACHPVIDTNVRIVGGAESQAANPNGIHCATNQGVPSRCVVLGNQNIQGSGGGFPPVSVGVRCDDGACMRIANNVVTGRGGVTTVGIWLSKAGTFVDDNTITAGCGTTAIGVRAQDSFARLQNNLISGGGCNVGTATTMTQSWGMRILTSSGPNELDVNSNTIDGAGMVGTCTSGAVDMDVTGTPPTSGVGIFRNDILRGGLCTTARFDFREAAAAGDPRIFENNDLDPTGAPTLYYDNAATALGTIGAVNGLTDMTVSANLSADPLFVTYPTNLHIQGGSPCIDKGTVTGAPAVDMDGAARSTPPDIGADEH